MRLRWGVGITAAAGLLAAIAIFAWPRPNDPVYQGRTLSQWLDSYVTARWAGASDVQEAKVAENAVLSIGTNAVPWLLGHIDEATPPATRKLLQWYYYHVGRPPRTEYYQSFGAVGAADARAILALTGFELLGSQAREAIPELTRRMKAGSNGCDAKALALIGQEGIPPLLAALSDSRPPKQCTAAIALLSVRDFGTYTNATAAALIKAIKNPNDDVAECAAFTLGLRALAPEQAVPTLIDSLSSPHDQYRRRAISALGGYKGAARAAIPALMAIANESNALLRFEATNALDSIASDTNQQRQIK